MEFLYIIKKEGISMKSLWNSFKIVFAMFSKIPVPQAEWTKENMKYMFCFFSFYRRSDRSRFSWGRMACQLSGI